MRAIQRQRQLNILRAITALSASLNLPASAEGVDTEEELNSIQAAGCSEAQGCVFGAASPVWEFPALEATAPLQDSSPPSDASLDRF
jgi:EAL domain-containing protein (putative c-di-GMP-specific phosphodiesterase class I)